MSRKSTTRLSFVVWLLAMAMAVTAVVLEIGRPGASEDPLFVVTAILMGFGYATMGAVVASRQPRNPIGWLFLTVGASVVATGVLDNYAARALASRGSLPGASVAAWITNATFFVSIPPIPLVLLLFPTGRLPSRRWRPVAWAIVLGSLVGVIGTVIRPGPVGFDGELTNPFGVESLAGLASALQTVAAFVSIPAGFACVAALVARFRRSRGDERQQLRWLAYAAGAAALLMVVLFSSFFWAGEDEGPVTDGLFIAFLVLLGIGIPVASGFAILKYRLYDLDIVVKKTVVFGLLAAFITAVYVLVAIGLPTLLIGVGSDSGFSPIHLLSVAIVALLIQPVRNRARRLADRLVYGKRATPYEVLSEFSDRMGGTYSTEDVLPRMAQLVTSGTGAASVEVWLHVGDELRLEAAWPSTESKGPAKPIVGLELPGFEGREAFPVTHQGELLGAIAVRMPPSDPLTEPQRQLIEDLSAQAGLVLRNVALTADLRARLEELRASRQRLVAAQDEERRRLERNIHDGAQQQLVAIGVKLGLADTLLDRDPAQAHRLLDQLRRENQEALDDLRDLARGIYPPLLADQGLAAALQSQARKSPVPVRVHADGTGRHPQEVEAAVYFSVLEALQNVAKYARASAVVVRLARADDELRFEVQDDGIGFDPATTPRGSGLQNMADRLATLGGSIEVESSPGSGTSVRGRIPTVAEARVE